uniref:Uncharacterized protein n=1 Tax=Oryza rufipogon TaxID=4529 RepID=A0A0E0R7J3_ORYRU
MRCREASGDRFQEESRGRRRFRPLGNLVVRCAISPPVVPLTPEEVEVEVETAGTDDAVVVASRKPELHYTAAK